MKIIKENYNKLIEYPEKKYFKKSTCLIDIETTGFSRIYNHIYMIGLARKNNDDFIVTLLFAESPDEEKEVLEEFLRYSKDIEEYITFNGLSFDFPFIKARMEKYGIKYDFKKYNHLDIYKECKPLKKMLKLDNLKQKTIEHFLKIDRNDIYTGGELIEHYITYTKCHEKDCYNNLIMHNLEDVKGMVDILPILRYVNLSKNMENATISNIEKKSDKEIIINMKSDIILPERFSLQDEYCYCIMDKNNISVILHPYPYEMKLFLKEYKNYVYIDSENVMIPKQLLNSQNKKEARSVKKEDCYILKEGLFTPIYNLSLYKNEKTYKKNYHDKTSYIDITEHLEDESFMTNYTLHLIKHLI